MVLDGCRQRLGVVTDLIRPRSQGSGPRHGMGLARAPERDGDCSSRDRPGGGLIRHGLIGRQTYKKAEARLHGPDPRNMGGAPSLSAAVDMILA